jgi:5'-3' exonuclease
MNDCTLVVDGNYFIYSRLHVLPKPKKTSIVIDGKTISTRLLDDKKEMATFMLKLATDFASEIRKFKNLVNRVVFVVDSKSWRKDFNSEYKANRKFSDDINMEHVHEIMRAFQVILEDRGVIVEQVPGAEGDDMIFAWSTYLNSIGENCIMWTGDKDLKQLVNYNNATESFSLWYDNTRNRMGVYPGFDKWLEQVDEEAEIDIFNVDDDDVIGSNKKQMIKDLINYSKLNVEKVFCDEFSFIKILTGDKGDNVSSVVLKPSKNGGKSFKISENKAQEILALFKSKNRRFSSSYLFNESYKKDIVRYIKNVMSVDIHESEIMECLERNINLILLHVETIPEAIQHSMFDVVKEHHKIRVNNFDILSSRKYILDNTEYQINDTGRRIDNVIKTRGLF